MHGATNSQPHVLYLYQAYLLRTKVTSEPPVSPNVVPSWFLGKNFEAAPVVSKVPCDHDVSSVRGRPEQAIPSTAATPRPKCHARLVASPETADQNKLGERGDAPNRGMGSRERKQYLPAKTADVGQRE